MNLELLENFTQNFPEDYDGTLDCMSVAITCQFNRRGTLLAVGCNDGRIFIWDFLTRGIAKIINAHVHPVCSLSWSRDGFNLISASTDNTVSVWELTTSECIRKYRFPSPFLKVQYNPRNNSMFLVCPLKYATLIVYNNGDYYELPLDDENDPNVISSFDRRGEYIFCGNSKGKISVFKSSTRELLTTFKVTSGNTNSAAIKQIEFARRGNSFLVNTADRIIRVYDMLDILKLNKDSEPEPQQKLQDLVNRALWKKCCFSGDGEYICAGSSRQHSLYIWEKSIGNLVKILHGTKGEMLLDVVWHPVRPLIASVSSGVVSIWSQNQVENWSAFAPDFKELDENVEYEERESEFDLEDEDKSVHITKDVDEEDVDVDITTVKPIQAFLSSDEEGDEEKQLLFLTITPEFDDLDENMQNEPPVVPEKSKKSKLTDKSLLNSQANAAAAAALVLSTNAKQPITYNINLSNAPSNETHPLMVGVRRQSSVQSSSSVNNAKHQ